MTGIVRGTWAVAACASAIVACAGCNSPTAIAVQLVGKAVDAVDADQLGKELVGQPVSSATAKLGQPMDTWREVGRSRAWLTYPVAMDVLGNLRYVVAASGNRITSVSKVKVDGSGIDIARKVALEEKARGKTPAEVEAALGMGRPLVTARSDASGQICQLYDAKIIKEVGSPQYCRVRFDANQRCTEVALVDITASTAKNPA